MQTDRERERETEGERQRQREKNRQRDAGGNVELIATHGDKLDKIKKIYSNNCEL